MKSDKRVFLLLHLLLLVYSFSSVLSKIAASLPVFSPQFFLCYAGIIGLLGFYAVGWQQVIKRLPLTVAYANRAVAVFWGIVWGILFFHESISVWGVFGALIVLVGIAVFASDEDGPEGADAS